MESGEREEGVGGDAVVEEVKVISLYYGQQDPLLWLVLLSSSLFGPSFYNFDGLDEHNSVDFFVESQVFHILVNFTCVEFSERKPRQKFSAEVQQPQLSFPQKTHNLLLATHSSQTHCHILHHFRLLTRNRSQLQPSQDSVKEKSRKFLSGIWQERAAGLLEHPCWQLEMFSEGFCLRRIVVELGRERKWRVGGKAFG